MSEEIERLLESLQLQIEERDERIAELEEELTKAKCWADHSSFWHPRIARESELPVPRLQIELTIHSEYNHEWIYSIVYRHTTGDLISIPISNTISNGSHRHDRYDTQEAMEQALPFRNGVEIRKDSTSLNLPAYAIAPGFPPVLLSRLPAPEPLNDKKTQA